MTEEVKADEDSKPRLPRDEAKAIADLTGLNLEANSHAVSIVAIRKMAVAEVIDVYTRIDQMFDDIISQHFLVRPFEASEDKDEKWRKKLGEKRIQFRHLLLDNLTHIKKKDAVHAISKIPGEIHDIIQRINSIRNDLAHSANPWDRRPSKFDPSTFNSGGRVNYRGVDIFSEAGLKELQKDYKQVSNCLGAIFSHSLRGA